MLVWDTYVDGTTLYTWHGMFIEFRASYIGVLRFQFSYSVCSDDEQDFSVSAN
jgi:hypothetical protein